MRTLRALLLMMSLLLLASCSANRFGYNHLDKLAGWLIADYVTLTPAQRSQFEHEFSALWRWHRQTELPLYASQLRTLATTLDGPWTPERIEAQRKLAEADGLRLLDRALPPSASLLATLDDAQLAALSDKLRKDLAKQKLQSDKRAARTPEERQRRRFKESREALSDWLGPLSEAQQAQLAATLTEMTVDRAALQGLNEAWMNGLIAVLQQRKAADFEQQLSNWFRTPSLPGYEAVQAQLDANRARWMQLLATLGNTLSDRQRTHLRQRLLDYADDCSVLTQQPADE